MFDAIHSTHGKAHSLMVYGMNAGGETQIDVSVREGWECMGDRLLLIGEAAKVSGLTIRTLQHYDNIGLLPASGRQENGRRYYTQTDLMTLEQIVFYRGLGFSLEEIKERLIAEHTPEQIEKLFSQQEMLLYMRIETMQTNLAVIEASRELTNSGKTPPWALLASFMQSLEKSDLATWSRYSFTEEQSVVLDECFPTTGAAMEFYHSWKRLSIKAAAFHAVGLNPVNPLAQRLAEDWLAVVRQIVDDKPERMEAFLQVDQNRDAWNEAERQLIEDAEPFLSECVRLYQQKNPTGE